MNLLSRIFRRDSEAPPPATIVDQDTRRAQLEHLEGALDALASGMRADDRLMANPGWRGRVAEYDRAASNANRLRRTTITREELVDLAFEIRPLFPAEPPKGQEHLLPLQEAVVSAAHALGDTLPSERP